MGQVVREIHLQVVNQAIGGDRAPGVEIAQAPPDLAPARVGIDALGLGLVAEQLDGRAKVILGTHPGVDHIAVA